MFEYFYHQVQDAIDKANKLAEIDEIAGELESSPYDELLEILETGVAQVKSIKGHKHDFVVSEETDRCYCTICGADGDA